MFYIKLLFILSSNIMATTNLELMQAAVRGDNLSNERQGFTFPPPVAHHIGFKLTDITDAPSATIEMAVNLAIHANPMGTLHGGVLCDIADAAIGCAHWGALTEGESFTSIDLKINFFRPVWKGSLRATSKLINSGKTVSYYSCDIIRIEDGKLIATVTSTVMTLRGDMAKGR